MSSFYNLISEFNQVYKRLIDFIIYYSLVKKKFGIIIKLFKRVKFVKMCAPRTTKQDDTRLDDKIVLITGANTGIGIHTVIDLAKRGAAVVMACRNLQKSEPALKEAKEKSGSENIDLMQLDLSSLNSVRTFAENFSSKYDKLHILINNAGIMMCPFKKTEDGFESQIGTNHFGHFALTNLLLKKLAASAPSRVITVSSVMHKQGKIDFDDINYDKRSYSDSGAYNQSKLANILFTKELHKKAVDHGITAYALHPGVVTTDLSRSSFTLKVFYGTVGRVFGKTPVQGAQTTIYCAVTEGLEKDSGGYFVDSKLASSSRASCNEEDAKRLWELSEELTNTKFEL